MQRLVVYCNATLNQYQGERTIYYNTAVYRDVIGNNNQVTDNAINCCLRCAFTAECNVWVRHSLLSMHIGDQSDQALGNFMSCLPSGMQSMPEI